MVNVERTRSVAPRRMVWVLGAGQAAARGLVALYSIALVRALSPAGYSDFAYAVALVTILTMIADGGVSRLLMRDLGGGKAWGILRQLLRIRTGWIIVCAGALTASGVTGALRLSPGLLPAAVAFLVMEAGAMGFESAAVGVERPWLAAGGQMLGAATLTVALVVIITVGSTAGLAVAGMAAASAAKLAWHLIHWRSGLLRRMTEKRGPLRGPLRGLLVEALPFLGLNVLAALYYRSGVIVLHSTRGARETASYAAAFRVVEAAAVLGTVVFAAYAPHFSRLHREAPESVWLEWRRLMRQGALLAAVGCAGLALVAPALSGDLFGGQYGGVAGEDLRILAFGLPFLLLQSINATLLLMGAAQRLVFATTLANVAVAVTLTVIGALVLGSRGVALATSISEALAFVNFAFLIRRQHGHRARQHEVPLTTGST